MNKLKWLLRAILTLAAMGGIGMNANAGLFGLGGTSWKEEVLLHDGTKIIVERSVERGGRHEIGQKPPIKEQSLSFTPHGASKPVTWEDRYSEDVGGANFLPMLLDVINGTPYLVTNPMGCLSYNKWGRPNPPYVIFKHDGTAWQRIPLQELPAKITTPNLIFSMPDIEAEKFGKGLVSAEAIHVLDSASTAGEGEGGNDSYRGHDATHISSSEVRYTKWTRHPNHKTPRRKSSAALVPPKPILVESAVSIFVDCDCRRIGRSS